MLGNFASGEVSHFQLGGTPHYSASRGVVIYFNKSYLVYLVAEFISASFAGRLVKSGFKLTTLVPGYSSLCSVALFSKRASILIRSGGDISSSIVETMLPFSGAATPQAGDARGPALLAFCAYKCSAGLWVVSGAWTVVLLPRIGGWYHHYPCYPC